MDAIVADERVIWIPVKHYSPACAWHAQELIRSARPAAVLVEGPDDADPWIPWIVDPETRPPVTLLSAWVDKRNKLGRNGVLSAAEDVPARYRGWWPLVAYGPEYAALRAGTEVGAEVRFIDASLKALLPVMAGSERTVGDRELAENSYFDALAARTGAPDFEAFWHRMFEARGLGTDPVAFRRAVLTFAWCARHLGGEEVDPANGLREAHMRWHIDQALEAHPEGQVAVVTGAYHSVALPWVKRKRAAGRPGRDCVTLLCPHSHRALARLATGAAAPGWSMAVWQAACQGDATPHDSAALQILVDIGRRARDAGAPVGAADAVGALQVARHLAALRGGANIGPRDVRDAVRTAYVKGDVAVEGPPVFQAAERVLVGSALGAVAEGAGRPPLVADFYARAKALRLDLSGADKVVRCDVHKQVLHRRKSAFLHRCLLLDIPVFGDLGGRGPFRGPDLGGGRNLHLTTETWAVSWSEDVDDRLVELSDRGTTIEVVAASALSEVLHAAGDDVEEVARTVLTAAQARVLDGLPVALDRLLAAAHADRSLGHLMGALQDIVLLGGYHAALPAQGDARLAEAAVAMYTAACLQLPESRHVADEEAPAALDRLQSLVRIAVAGALPGPAPDRGLLVERLRDLLAHDDGQPLLRGGATGVLFALGVTTDRAVAAELTSYLQGPLDRILRGGAFLEGVLRTARDAFLTSPRLLNAVHAVLLRLDDDGFRRILPDLRRAFSVFIPAELDRIGQRVSEELLLTTPADPDAPLDPAELQRVARVEARVGTLLVDPALRVATNLLR